MPLSEDRPPYPKWQVSRTRKKAAKIRQKIPNSYDGDFPLDHQLLSFLAIDLEEIMEVKKDEQRLALVDTLTKYQGRVLPLTQLCLQLAANAEKIKRGFSVPPFKGVSVAEWVPFVITGVKPDQAFGRPVLLLELLVTDGPYAGQTATRQIPPRFAPVLARSIGFTRRYYYEKPQELKGLQMAGYLTPTQEPELVFTHHGATPTMCSSNRKIIKIRKEAE